MLMRLSSMMAESDPRRSRQTSQTPLDSKTDDNKLPLPVIEPGASHRSKISDRRSSAAPDNKKY